MTTVQAIAGFALAATFATPSFAEPMRMDTPIQMNGLEVVCTGIGSAKDDPQWSSYPIRIEFSNGGAQYLSGAHVQLNSHGRTLADFDCPGAWVLVNGRPGTYSVTAAMDGSTAKPARASFSLGSHGQKRVVLRFPDFQPNQ